jgi:DNA primase
VERLAAEAGVALPTPSREAQAQETRRRSLHDVTELAAQFFESALQDRRAARARDYLVQRGLGPETQRRFRIGYAPGERFALRDHLAAKGVPVEMMVEAGLLVTGDDVKIPYDRFRERVMFPIGDVKGRVIAFGGRALSPDVPAKYLNSPDTPLFSKGRVLYNLDRARQPAHERGTVIAVEGYIDVIALSAAGFPNAVAPLGTALTEDQLQLLWRCADEPVLCFDGDAAGRRAAYRAVDMALPALAPGKSLRFALLPEGQDPDDLARSGGAAAVERVLKGARPLVDILWVREIEAGPLDTPERRAALEARLKEALLLIRDETLRRYYREEVELRLTALHPDTGRRPRRDGAPGRGWRDRRGASPVPGRAPLWASPMLTRSPLFSGGPSVSPREAMILSVLSVHPELLHDYAEALAELDFAGRDAGALRALLLDNAGSEEPADVAVMEARLERAGLKGFVERLAGHVRPGDRWTLDPHADPLRLADALRQAMILHRRARTLHSELRAAERALAEEETEANLAWLREVQEQLSSADGAEADPG